MGVGYDPEVVEALISVAASLPGIRREDEERGAAWTG
jgi:response regulator RpfG family c-di-GMP phosphodiesterase